MMIFFDVDETLVNQRKAELAAAVHFLAAYGRLLPRRYTPAEFCRVWRTLREHHLPAFLKGDVQYGEHRRRRIRDLFLDGRWLSDAEVDTRFQAFQHHYRHAWSLFDDVLPGLDRLTGYRLGVLSNGSGAQQRQKLQQTGIADRFETVVISEDVGRAKPGREIFLTACRLAGCAPEACVYVGDRLEADARGSAAAGLRGVWLCRGGTYPPAGIETIQSLIDLRTLLERPPRRRAGGRGTIGEQRSAARIQEV